MAGQLDRTTRIRELNDALRCHGLGGQTLITRGIAALGREGVSQVVHAVRAFRDFEPGNDPYGEHDFGAITFNGQAIFWKIDYYDKRLEMHSPDPTDPLVTERVLTIMLAEEY